MVTTRNWSESSARGDIIDLIGGIAPFSNQSYPYQGFDKTISNKIAPTVLVYGDSNVAWVDTVGRVGIGQGSWPAYLESYLEEYIYYCEGRVRGDGSPGETAAYGKTQYSTFISTFLPQIMILHWGTNDIGDGRTLTDYLADMEWIIQQNIAGGVFTIVQDIPWIGVSAGRLNTTYQFNEGLKSLCDRYKVPFISTMNLSAGTTPLQTVNFYADTVHFTDAFNQQLAALTRDAVIDNYGLPKDRFNVNKVQWGDGIDTQSWDLTGITNTYGKELECVVTPDQYVRRFYPLSLRIPAGQEVGFRCYGPGGILINRPDTGVLLTVNGSDTVPLSRGATYLVAAVSSRMNGSLNAFRIGAKTGSNDVYIVATHFWQGPQQERALSTTAIKNGQYRPNKTIEITNGTYRMLTIMAPLVGSSTADVGYDPHTGIQNVGTTLERTALVAGYLAPGFRFYDLDLNAFYRWNSTTSAWVLA